MDGAPRPAMSRVMTDDERDLLDARSGSSQAPAAFARLYDRHSAAVLALCRHALRSGGRGGAALADAEDALQEVFLRAFRMLDRVKVHAELDAGESRVPGEDCTGGQRSGEGMGAGGFRSWLYAIARHVCQERLRSDRRRSHHEQRAAGANTMGTTLGQEEAVAGISTIRASGASSSRPEDAAESREQLAGLDRALDQLPDAERLAIHLYYIEPDPVKAAFEALGLSRSGFYKLLSRARERLASLMSEAHA